MPTEVENHREEGRMSAAIERVETHLLNLLQTAAKHEKWLESIDRRLDILNGKVAAHEKRFADLEAARIEAEATKKADAKWWKRLQPVLRPIAWVAGALILWSLRYLPETWAKDIFFPGK